MRLKIVKWGPNKNHSFRMKFLRLKTFLWLNICWPMPKVTHHWHHCCCEASSAKTLRSAGRNLNFPDPSHPDLTMPGPCLNHAWTMPEPCLDHRVGFAFLFQGDFDFRRACGGHGCLWRCLESTLGETWKGQQYPGRSWLLSLIAACFRTLKIPTKRRWRLTSAIWKTSEIIWVCPANEHWKHGSQDKG